MTHSNDGITTTNARNANANGSTTERSTPVNDTHTNDAASPTLADNPAPPLAVMPPPATANIPSPPVGFTPVKGGFGRGVRPLKAELVAMPDAVVELRRFANWEATLGKAAPDHDEMVAAFDSAAQWSAMKGAIRAWNQYTANEEAIAWLGARALMATVKPLFKSAVAADPSIATAYPKLCALFGAKSSIAKKAVSTKAANKKAGAEGKPATHGAVGKKRQQAAAKAALAEKEAASASKPAATPTSPPVNGSNGVTHA